MGNLFGCIDEVSHIQRVDYDMTPVKTKPLPIIWIVGAPGSGRNVYVNNICNDFQFEHIKVSDLIKNEATNETERGNIIKDVLANPNKKIPDPIVVDLIKEAMLLKSKQAKGYVFDGFPRTSKQALYFVNEIDNVDVIIYLHGKIDDMVHRVEQNSSNVNLTNELIRKKTINYMKEAKEAIHKFGPKIEKVYIEKPERDCYNEIEAAISSRIPSDTTMHIKKQITVTQEMVN